MQVFLVYEKWVEDFIEGSTLVSLMRESGPTPIPRLKFITSGILSAFDFLHDHAIVHKDLRPSSIFIDRNQKIRLADFSLDKKLYDIVCTLTNATPVDALPLPMGRSGKKQDVYRLGLLLLSLAQGAIVKDMVPDIASPDITQKFPLLFCDFLGDLLILFVYLLELLIIPKKQFILMTMRGLWRAQIVFDRSDVLRCRSGNCWISFEAFQLK